MLKKITCFSFFVLHTIASLSQSKKIKEIEKIAYEWAASNNEHNVERLKPLYASNITFYAKSKDLNTCLQEKQTFFNSNNDYTISISNLEIDFYKSGIVKCNFNKQESWKGKAQNPQQAYLLLEKRGMGYLIVAESDQRMDNKLGFVPQLGTKKDSGNNLLYISIGAFITFIILFILYFHQKNKKKIEIILKNPETIQNQNSNTRNDGSVVFNNKNLEENKGHEFEKFVADKFNKTYFQMIDTRSDKKFDNHIPLTNMYPDFEFLYIGPPRNVNFAVECKWRSDFFNNTIEWAKKSQLDNYRMYQLQTQLPVFIVLGVGGIPSQPNELYIIPLSDIDDCILEKEVLNRYYRHRKGDFFLDIPTLKLK